MDSEKLFRAILPDELIDNFDVDRFEKTDTRFDIWLDEKKVQMPEDSMNRSVPRLRVLRVPHPHNYDLQWHLEIAENPPDNKRDTGFA